MLCSREQSLAIELADGSAQLLKIILRVASEFRLPQQFGGVLAGQVGVVELIAEVLPVLAETGVIVGFD